MKAVQLLKKRSYFINKAGYCFKVENGKEEIIKNFKHPKTRELLVRIDGSEYKFLNLMLQHFCKEMKVTDTIKYTVTKDLRIPLESIRIKPFIGGNGLSIEQNAKLELYGCHLKARSANNRCEEIITGVQVFWTLSIHEYKCIFCGIKLHPKNWHLDHFNSLHQKGKNVFENIVPSCPTCNIMKGALEGNQFFAQCKRVANNYLFKDNVCGG